MERNGLTSSSSRRVVSRPSPFFWWSIFFVKKTTQKWEKQGAGRKSLDIPNKMEKSMEAVWRFNCITSTFVFSCLVFCYQTCGFLRPTMWISCVPGLHLKPGCQWNRWKGRPQATKVETLQWIMACFKNSRMYRFYCASHGCSYAVLAGSSTMPCYIPFIQL